MPSRIIEVPSFNYAAFYYPQILESLIVRKRIDVPELTDESDFDPYIQLLRSFALVGHLNNTLLDQVANEFSLPTAQLVESVREMLRLIDYELSSAKPATTDVVYELSKVFTASFEIISEAAQCASRAEGDSPVIFFEALTAVDITPGDVFTSVQSSDGGVFTDHTTEANSGGAFTPFTTPLSEDALYFGHANTMWNKLEVDVDTAMVNVTGIWEFYDGDFNDIIPTLVTDIGGGFLEFNVNSLLGVNDRRGSTVRVALNVTGAFVDVVSTWNGAVNIATTSLIGQTSPSTDIDDYTIGTDWTEFALATGLSFTDGTDLTGPLSQDGDIDFTLPQTALQNWVKSQINGTEAFWMRFRIITVSGPTAPSLLRCRMDTGKQFVIASVTQGRSAADTPLGSSNGAPNQTFETSRDHFIDNSQAVTVDAETWIRVATFLGSSAQDKHYTISLGEDDRATVGFGNGVNGRIPPVGVGNIATTYRFNAETDGNVGALKIVVDKTGLTFVNSLYNPRQAGGWTQAEGATEESLERAKLAGPASLRVKEVALNGDDAEVLTVAFEADDGTSPFSRATHIEEGFGPKTLELVTVAAGGVVPTAAQLLKLTTFFNGDKSATPPITKHYVSNHEVTAVAFVPRVIDVTAIVKAPEGVTVAQILNGLNQVVQPEAVKEDGVTFEWEFGGDVPISRLVHEIFNVDDRIEDVDISLPASDIVLAARELPTAGTFLITIVQ